MKYLVPSIVIPVLLFVGIVAYAMLRPPIIAISPLPPRTRRLGRTTAAALEDDKVRDGARRYASRDAYLGQRPDPWSLRSACASWGAEAAAKDPIS
jgi:hypothetical protein